MLSLLVGKGRVGKYTGTAMVTSFQVLCPHNTTVLYTLLVLFLLETFTWERKEMEGRKEGEKGMISLL